MIETLFTRSGENPSGKKFAANRIVPFIAAFLLMLSGSLLRFWCVYLVAPFVAMMFFLKVFEQRKEEKIVRQAITKAGVCLLLLSGLFMFQFVGTYINNQSPEYKAFYEFNLARAKITDTRKFAWEEYEKEFEAHGLDILDFAMVDSWSFVDNDNYPVERLDEIGNVYQSVFENSSPPVERFTDAFFNPYFLLNPVSMCSLLLGLLVIALDRKSAGRVLICFLGQFVMLCVFIYIGRFPYRIIYGLGFALFAAVLSCASIKDIPEKGLKKALVLLTAILVAIHVPTYIKDRSYKDLSYEEYNIEAHDIFQYSSEYSGRRNRYAVNEEKPYQNIIQHMENDSEHYYLCDIWTTIQSFRYYYSPWERMPLNYWNDNYSYLGGCTMGYPENQECWEANGINGFNPYKSLINDNVYVVDNFYIKVKLLYLREHYYPNANVKLVEVIDGYSIWKFYLE